MAIVGITIAVIVCAVVLIPVVQESTEITTTFTNDGYFRMTHYGTDTDITITWSSDKPKTFVVNDEEITINYDVSGGSVTVIADTNFLVRFNESSKSLTWVGTSGGSYGANESATFTFLEGTVNATLIANGNTQTRTTTYTDVYVPSLNGSFVMKKYDKPSYLNADSEIFAYGLSRVKLYDGTTSSSPGYGIEFNGSIEDGLTSRVWRGSDTLSLSNETINYTTDASYIDLFVFNDITATATITQTVDDEPVTTDTVITYNYLLVPYQVTAEKSVHLDQTSIQLINVIPILVIIGIVMLAVGTMIYYRR